MRLRTKFALVMTSLVLFVVAVLSYIFAAQLLEQLIQETDKRANDLAMQVFLQAKHSLVEAAQQGLHPDSDAPKTYCVVASGASCERLAESAGTLKNRRGNHGTEWFSA